MINIIRSMIGYANGSFNSGIYSKFIPYIPAINVKGINIVEITVNIFIVMFKLLLNDDKYILVTPSNDDFEYSM